MKPKRILVVPSLQLAALLMLSEDKHLAQAVLQVKAMRLPKHQEQEALARLAAAALGLVPLN